ncbi:putative ATPase [Micromonospora pisi]|uniref:Putative ATPase n=1 Tax=Micromonospora pisi TaxID=589240 RepID=A0A495JV21_9ACTN|nr:LuxR family transcriptional regulator [Micromonospora pisi]RKR91989.1 putative ATPase [Micromonospora pisi]
MIAPKPVADARPRLLGREPEMDRMRRLLTGTGEPVFVVLTGDPGMGKSQLLAAFATAATDRPALLGRATEFERSAPLALVLDLLEDADRHPGLARPAGRLRVALTARIGPTTPDAAVSGAGPAAGLERHLLFRKIRTALETTAATTPLLLLLDDVQWADDASTALIDYLVRHPPRAAVVTVLAARTGRLPAELHRSLDTTPAQVVRMPLGPLSPADADLLLADRPAAYRRRLYRAGGGNPLYLEILNQLPGPIVHELGRTPTTGESGPAAIGPAAIGLDVLIARDLQALDGLPRRVVHAAALTGAELDVALVAAAAGTTEEEAAAALDELVRRDLLRVVNGELTFRHPLVRAAAYRMAGPAWRAAAHGRAVVYLTRQGAPLYQRAEHLQHAVRPGDLAGAELLATAAAATLETAPATAVCWLRPALRVLPDGPALAERRAELRLLLAEALIRTGRLDEAREILHSLVAGASTLRYRAVELLAVTERAVGRLAEARALLGAALVRADADRSHARAGLLVEFAATEMLQGNWDAGVERSSQALALAGDDTRSAISVTATTLLALSELYQCRFGRGFELLERARRGTDALTDVELRGDLGVVAALAWAEYLVDQHEDGLRHVERGLRLARASGRTGHEVSQLYVVRSVIHARTGDAALALADVEDGEESARHIDSPELRAFTLALKSRPLLWQRGPEAALPILAELRREQSIRSAWWRGIADQHEAEVLFFVDQTRACRDLLARRLSPDPTGLGPYAPSVYALRAQAEAACGDLTAAWEWYERAAAVAATGAPRAQLGCVTRTQAVLYAAEGRYAQAREAGMVAVEHFEATRLPIGAGLARTVVADILVRSGDWAAASDQLGRAREAFDGCGAPWLSQWVGREQRRAGARQPRDAARDQLSGREREIATLVAEGLTSPQIAAQLFLSPRTVESHLNRIFAKLGVSTRAALARLVTAESGVGR